MGPATAHEQGTMYGVTTACAVSTVLDYLYRSEFPFFLKLHPHRLDQFQSCIVIPSPSLTLLQIAEPLKAR